MMNTLVDDLKNTSPIYKNMASIYCKLKEFTQRYDNTREKYNKLLSLKYNIINPLKYKSFQLLPTLPYTLDPDSLLWKMSIGGVNSKKTYDVLNNRELVLNNILDYYLSLYIMAEEALVDFENNYFEYVMEYLRVKPTMSKDKYIVVTQNTLYVLEVENKTFFGYSVSKPISGVYSFSEFGRIDKIPKNYNIGGTLTKDWLMQFYPEDFL